MEKFLSEGLRKPAVFVIISAFVIILSGCAKKTADIIVEAVEIASVNIDSANVILDKISDPEHLTEEQQYQYNRLRVLHMINYTMKWDSADSLNNVIIDYCTRKNDTTKLMPALYRAGWISINKDKADRAIEQFLGLKKIAEEQRDSSMIRNCCYYLSYAYSKKKENENTLIFAKERLKYYTEADTISKAGAFRVVASLYKQINEVDSALYYFNNSLALYEKTSADKYYSSLVHNEISDLLLKNDNYKDALKYVELSLQNRSRREDVSFFNFTKARVFLAANQSDSAIVYLKIAIESSDNDYISIAAYNHLADLYKNDGDYRNAFLNRINQRDVFESGEQSLVYDLMRQKYQEERLKNENNELKLAKRDQEILFLSVALVLLVVIVSLWVYVIEDRKRKKIKEQTLIGEALLAKSQLVENENKLFKLSDIGSSVRYVYLQEPPDIKFTSISNVLSDDKHIFIHSHQEGLFCYSAEGKYLYALCANKFEKRDNINYPLSGIANRYNVDILNGNLIFRTYNLPPENEKSKFLAL